MPARPRPLVAVLGALALGAALLTQPGGTAGAAPDTSVVPVALGGDPAGARAVALLDEATAVLRGAASDRGTSMVLLDLARARVDLPAARRAEADRLLARPTDGAADPLGFGYGPAADPTRACADGFCVHWARATDDAPDLVDGDANGRPDAVDRVFTTLATVGGAYAQAGYRTPVPDGGRGGGSNLFDVYLVESGENGIYGYCAPESVVPGARSAPSYCALDNDFAEFPTHTPVENMQVTVAHEYFHAVQFAYDLTDDTWFLESTAAWVEDEVFDEVDDNVQYLGASPMRQPTIPIDRGRDLRVYGSWIFFRYLGELEPAEQGGLPTIIRDIWERAAGTSYSIKAVEEVLQARGRSMTRTVATFFDANRHPGRRYAEGGKYPAAKPTDSTTLASGRSKRRTFALDHLASGTLRVKPGAGTRGKGSRLRVTVDLPGRGAAVAAVVTTRAKSGRLTTRLVRLNRSGAGSLRVPFASRRIGYVDVTLVNASTRFRCDQGTAYSCRGTARDDRLNLRVRVRAVR